MSTDAVVVREVSARYLEEASDGQRVPAGYKQTEVGVIPEDWDIRPLAEAVEFLDGRRRPVKDSDRARMRGIYPYYGASGIVDYVNDYLFDEELILLGEDGENILSRNCRLAFRVSGKIWVNNHAHVLRPKTGFDIGFLAEYLESLDYAQYNTGTAQPKLNKQVCSRILVVAPTEKEQHAIAAALSDVDALIAALDKLIAKKRAIKTATMQQLLTGKQRLPGFGGEWEVRRLDEVADIDDDNLPSGTSPNFEFNYISLEDVDCGFLRSFSIQYFRSAPSRARRRLRNGDILVSTVRPNLKSHLLFQRDEGDWVCSTGFSVVRCKAGLAAPGFVFQHLFEGDVPRQIEALIAGSNYPAINGRDVKAFRVPIPPLEEQTAIATILSDMDAEIAALETRRDKTRALKQGMMQELLTGRTRLV